MLFAWKMIILALIFGSRMAKSILTSYSTIIELKTFIDGIYTVRILVFESLHTFKWFTHLWVPHSLWKIKISAHRTKKFTNRYLIPTYWIAGPIRTGNADGSQSDGFSRSPVNRQHSTLLIWNSSAIRSLVLGVREKPCAWLSSGVPALLRPE